MLNGYQQDYRLLHSESPNALDSGYLVLTALDGTVSPTPNRSRSSSTSTAAARPRA